MEIVYRKLSELKPNPKNPRKATDGAIARLAASIKENPKFFEARPVLLSDRTGELVIIGGERRSEAAALLKMKTVPTILLSGLTEQEEDEILIKDNTHAGVWDEQKLQTWERGQLQSWNVDGVKWPKQAIQAKEDDFDPDKKVKSRVKRGDIWQLGEHRLMCGDSMDAEQVALLMNGERADIAFTSPPYNLGASKMSDKCPNKAMKNGTAYNEYDDNVSDDEYTELIEKSLGNALDFTDDAMFNIGILKSSKEGIIRMMYDFKDRFCDIIVWNKCQSMPLGLPSHAGCIGHRCELIFCFNKSGNRAFSHPQWKHGAQINRIDTENASGNEYAKQHAATFPVALPSEVIKAFTDSSVLDLFGGTGTTMIAAEQLGRRCYMMELDPHYCDVIINRWEEFTGQKAKKIE